jgi:hypothetical protein
MNKAEELKKEHERIVSVIEVECYNMSLKQRQLVSDILNYADNLRDFFLSILEVAGNDE